MQIGLRGKESACNAGDLVDSWVGKIPREGNSYPLQYSCLGNSMDRGAWKATESESDTTERLGRNRSTMQIKADSLMVAGLH